MTWTMHLSDKSDVQHVLLIYNFSSLYRTMMNGNEWLEYVHLQ